ncbi:MAG: type I-C CRISPR-associated protein Cas5 [Magnetococcales bacterium]|nr:type I-C CRISPR-associated protein Cas5 [Magnetococcales bacterium]MBF0116524.1 type I-C CRISPR-associated protein Cas5 [Magnetococcales bacterium]
MSERNQIDFRVSGRYALFTDPNSRLGGEKCSYFVPTYEALKGIAKSIYWKPTFYWVIDAVRVMQRIRTQTRGTKPRKFTSAGNDLAIYTFLADVDYQVRAHFEWNLHRPELAEDRIEGKHYALVSRMVEKGGRQDVFLGVRDCQGYVEPCDFGSGDGEYDGYGELSFGVMFHSFGYPDETGTNQLTVHLWQQTMENGIIRFVRPEACPYKKPVREMRAKKFGQGRLLGIEAEIAEWGG